MALAIEPTAAEVVVSLALFADGAFDGGTTAVVVLGDPVGSLPTSVATAGARLIGTGVANGAVVDVDVFTGVGIATGMTGGVVAVEETFVVTLAADVGRGINSAMTVNMDCHDRASALSE
jgi:hypothetical protein